MKSSRYLTIILILLSLFAANFAHPAHAHQDDPIVLYDVRWSGQWIGLPSNNGLWLFDTENPDTEPLHYLAGHIVSTLAFDPIRDRIAAYDENTSYLRILDLTTGETIEHIYIETPPEDFFPVVYDIQYSDDGTFLVVTTGARIHVIDASSSNLQASFFFPDSESGGSAWTTTIDFGAKSGDIIAGNFGNNLMFFNAGQTTLQNAVHLTGDPHGVYRIEAVPNSTAIIAHGTGLWSYDTATDTSTLLDPLFAEGVQGFDLNLAGDTLAVGMDGQIVLYDLTEQAITQTALTDSPTNASVFALSFNADSTQLVTLDTAGRLTIWDVTSGTAVAQLGDFTRAVSYKWG